MSEFSTHENESVEQEPRFRTEKIGEITNEIIDRSLNLDSVCYPPDMMSPKEEYEEVLNDPTGVHVALEDEKGFCGQILSYDFAKDYDEVKKEDLELEKPKNGEALYVYTIAIRPETEGLESVRSLEALRTLWDGFRKEAVKAGYKKVVAYARVENGLSRILQKKCNAKFFRRKENWLEMQEPFDYLEIPLEQRKAK